MGFSLNILKTELWKICERNVTLELKKCTEFCVKCGRREKKLATSIFKNILCVPSTLETKTYFLSFTPEIFTVLFTHIWIRWVITYLIIKCPSWPGFLFLLIRSVSHFIKLSSDGKHDVGPTEDLKFIVFWSGIKSLICISMCLVSKQPFDTNSKALFQLNIINNNIFTIVVIFLSTCIWRYVLLVP